MSSQWPRRLASVVEAPWSRPARTSASFAWTSTPSRRTRSTPPSRPRWRRGVRQARDERQQRFVRPPAAPVVTARMTSDAQGHDYQAIARSAVASTEAPRAQSSGVLHSAGLCERPSMLGTKSIAVGMRVPIV